MDFSAYDAAHWAGFFTAALLLNISPGPDIAYIIGRTAQGGKRSGFAAMLGIWVGTLAHITLTAAGLSAVLSASPFLFMAIRLAGAAFLIWIGLSSLWSSFRDTRTSLVEREHRLQPGRSFIDGILVSLLNVKVALFFLAFLPQFVVEGAGEPPLQLALHGVLILVVAALVEPLLIVVVAGLSTTARASALLAVWLDRAFGLVFVMLGLAVLTSSVAF